MAETFWPYWRLYNTGNSIVDVKELVPCSPNNPIPSYVVAVFNKFSPHPQPGYAYYKDGLFSSGYFMVEKKKLLVTEKELYYFLVGGDVSFRPHTEVPENLWYKVGYTNDSKPIYIGTINIGGEEICGPVIDGVSYAYKEKLLYSDDENYNVLALNEK
ncbi:Hypothetical predicted protein [Cloeon dipterum]|uniref:Uncharacterized protein n=1 Tax=Cloeon dipterum TaxID=197152 RepID=A0A8S1DVX4_9INSE|nr:Hypothetical predicted protein [Cloeon dipterum]